jgi:hypothetical protein
MMILHKNIDNFTCVVPVADFLVEISASKACDTVVAPPAPEGYVAEIGFEQSPFYQSLKIEIIQNLSEKVADLTAKGMSKEDAVSKAAEDFGDINDLREELADSARAGKTQKLGLSLAFSIWGAILITALVMFINFYYTPATIWFVYPLFAVIWWPISLFFLWLRNKTGSPFGLPYSVCGFMLITGLMLFINLYYTPGTIWFVYPVFGTIWWPLVMLFYNLSKKSGRGGDGYDV